MNQAVNLTGAITGAGQFTTLGNGTVVITPNAGSAARSAANTVQGGSTLQISDFSTSTLGSGQFLLGTSSSSGTLAYTGIHFDEPLRLGWRIGTATVSVTNAATVLEFTSTIANNATGVSFTKAGAGTLLLSGGGNSFNQPVTVSAGTLAVRRIARWARPPAERP